MSGADVPWLRLVHAPILVMAPDMTTVRASTRAAAEWLGGDPVGRPLADFVGAAAAEQVRALLLGAGGEQTVPCVTAHGPVMMEVKAEPLPATAAGGGAVLTLSPCDPAVMVRAEALDWARTLERVTDGLPVGVAMFDAHWVEIYSNQLAQDLLGLSDVAQRTHEDWWGRFYPDPAERAARRARWRGQLDIARSSPEGYATSEGEVTCRDGRRRVLQFRFRFIGDIFTTVFWDVSEHRRLEEEMRRLATTDDLTGLLNRRGFSEQARAALMAASEGRAPVSLLMLDVDHFKRINDHYGHHVGDQVLEEFARRCRRHVRPEDLVARLGGEEFAVLLPATSVKAAHAVAEGLLAAIAGAPMRLGAVSLTVEASIGVASASLTGERLEDLMERADRALYAAKASGRNQVVLVPPVF